MASTHTDPPAGSSSSSTGAQPQAQPPRSRRSFFPNFHTNYNSSRGGLRNNDRSSTTTNPSDLQQSPGYKTESGTQTEWPKDQTPPTIKIRTAREFVRPNHSHHPIRQREALHLLLRQTRERSEERARRRERNDPTPLPALGKPWLDWQAEAGWQTVRDTELCAQREHQQHEREQKLGPRPKTVEEVLALGPVDDEAAGPLVVDPKWYQNYPGRDLVRVNQLEEAMRRKLRGGSCFRRTRMPTTAAMKNDRRPREFGAAMGWCTARLSRALGISEKQLPFIIWTLGLFTWFYTYTQLVDV